MPGHFLPSENNIHGVWVFNPTRNLAVLLIYFPFLIILLSQEYP